MDELSRGVPFEAVLERYKLNRKGKHIKIIDKRKAGTMIGQSQQQVGGMVKEV